MGAVFFRGIDPIEKGYAELKYWHQWHVTIGDAEERAAKGK